MNTLFKFSAVALASAAMLTTSYAQTTARQPMQPNAAIQAIQQATDPSAVVAAYASALELAMNNVSLHQAYVARMVDMGLPEMAYHQAQTLTTLQPNNGLAWGVLAYVDARRGQMTDAVAAINLAAPFAPNNQFVARTAGEIVAWYDQKADKSIISAQAKSGLARVRDLLGKQTAFTTAYDTAVRAYKAEASGQATPPAAPSSSDAAGAYAPQALPGQENTYVAPSAADYAPYYDVVPDYYYYYASGPGWIAPATWCWWYPYGYWNGAVFFPFGVTLTFGNYDHYYHHYYYHGGYGHHGTYAYWHNPGLWHHNVKGGVAFFGTPAHPSHSFSYTHQHELWSGVGGANATHWWSGTRTYHGGFMDQPSVGVTHPFTRSTVHPWTVAPSTPHSTFIPHTFSTPAYHWNSAWRSPTSRSFNSFHSNPSFHGSVHLSTPPLIAPNHESFGGFHGSAGVHSYGGFHGGFSGGHSFSGGFHGGGFSGGWHGGGGHR